MQSILPVKSAVAINVAAGVSTAAVCSIEVHERRYWIIVMAEMMALMLCVSLGSQCAAVVVSPSQTNGEMFNIERRR